MGGLRVLNIRANPACKQLRDAPRSGSMTGPNCVSWSPTHQVHSSFRVSCTGRGRVPADGRPAAGILRGSGDGLLRQRARVHCHPDVVLAHAQGACSPARSALPHTALTAHQLRAPARTVILYSLSQPIMFQACTPRTPVDAARDGCSSCGVRNLLASRAPPSL